MLDDRPDLPTLHHLPKLPALVDGTVSRPRKGTLRHDFRHRTYQRLVDLGPRGRVIMLANARVLGHVFDPLSVFWCFDTAGALASVLAEDTTAGRRSAQPSRVAQNLPPVEA